MTRNIARSLFPVVLLWPAISACSGPTAVESSASAVTVRYGISGEEEAMELARKICGAHQKKARLLPPADRFDRFMGMSEWTCLERFREAGGANPVDNSLPP